MLVVGENVGAESSGGGSPHPWAMLIEGGPARTRYYHSISSTTALGSDLHKRWVGEDMFAASSSELRKPAPANPNQPIGWLAGAGVLSSEPVLRNNECRARISDSVGFFLLSFFMWRGRARMVVQRKRR